MMDVDFSLSFDYKKKFSGNTLSLITYTVRLHSEKDIFSPCGHSASGHYDYETRDDWEKAFGPGWFPGWFCIRRWPTTYIETSLRAKYDFQYSLDACENLHRASGSGSSLTSYSGYSLEEIKFRERTGTTAAALAKEVRHSLDNGVDPGIIHTSTYPFYGRKTRVSSNDFPMDGRLRERSPQHAYTQKFTYIAGPKDIAFIETRNRECLRALTKEEAETGFNGPSLKSKLAMTILNECREEYSGYSDIFETESKKHEKTREKRLAEEPVKKLHEERAQKKLGEYKKEQQTKSQKIKLSQSMLGLFSGDNKSGRNDISARTLKPLLTEGADINYQDEKDGYTALMLAVIGNKDIKVLEYLLRNGANSKIKNKYQETASDLAANGSDAWRLLNC
ncbi:MAG: ankyrin repeat domain-containing protein [Gammaproteobacteria bacterium]|nr:ankyrin repeat domain-containing protein [Gammaproteobacteria bacterium]